MRDISAEEILPKRKAAGENRECVGCRHAKRQCDVGYCVFDVNGMCKAMEVMRNE